MKTIIEDTQESKENQFKDSNNDQKNDDRIYEQDDSDDNDHDEDDFIPVTRKRGKGNGNKFKERKFYLFIP